MQPAPPGKYRFAWVSFLAILVGVIACIGPINNNYAKRRWTPPHAHDLIWNDGQFASAFRSNRSPYVFYADSGKVLYISCEVFGRLQTCMGNPAVKGPARVATYTISDRHIRRTMLVGGIVSGKTYLDFRTGIDYLQRAAQIEDTSRASPAFFLTFAAIVSFVAYKSVKNWRRWTGRSKTDFFS